MGEAKSSSFLTSDDCVFPRDVDILYVHLKPFLYFIPACVKLAREKIMGQEKEKETRNRTELFS